MMEKRGLEKCEKGHDQEAIFRSKYWIFMDI
jgi:hypothetical protein